MPQSDVGPGSVVADRFRLEDLLEDTSGARFWRARDLTLARDVAVHVVAADDPRAPALLTAARVPNAPIRPAAELPDDPQVQAIGGIRAIPHPDIPEFRTVALPIQVDGAQLPIQCPPPLLGADTTDVLASLGYTAEQIADLLAQRVVAATDVELAEARR